MTFFYTVECYVAIKKNKVGLNGLTVVFKISIE